MTIYNKTEKLLITDCDGVLLYWAKAFEEYIKHELKWDVEGGIEQHYRIEDWLDIHPDEAKKLIDDFHSGDRLSALPPYKDAPVYVKKLAEEGWKFVVITACGPADETYRMRLKNLQDIFGDVFDKIHTVGVFDNKDVWLEKYEPTFWVEDTWRHARAGLAHGHKPLLMTADHNRNETEDGVVKVNNWEDIYNHIKENG